MDIYLTPFIPFFSKNCHVVPKYISVLTMQQISTLLIYDRKTELGANPFVVLPESIIKLDQNAQRGFADEFEKNLMQQKKKIDEIADTLLGKFEKKRVSLGTLVWNIRPDDGFIEVVIGQGKNKVKNYSIKISSDVVYLTDSAHRHFGIAEAWRRYVKNKKKYKGFDEKATFSVEVYNLDEDGECQLFNELNAKQNKISKTKQQAVDTVSPAGRLKSRILAADLGKITSQYDEQIMIDGGSFFNGNVEETTNQIANHKLLTMNVFMYAINLMFAKEELDMAAKDGDVADELSMYFVRFFHTLRETIQVQIDFDDGAKLVKPFHNLYFDRIEKIVPEGDASDDASEDASEKVIRSAFEDATKYAQVVREADKTNSNPVIRAFAKFGGLIRRMPRWDRVLLRIQTNGFEKKDSRLFQGSNPDMIQRSIATKKPDGKINIQVQNPVVDLIYEYFFELAGLSDTRPLLNVVLEDSQGRVEAGKYVVALNRSAVTLLEVEAEFWVGANVEVELDNLYIKVSNDREWSVGIMKTPKPRILCKKLDKLEIEHPIYPKNLLKYLARFEIDFPKYDKPEHEKFSITMDVRLPQLNGNFEANYKVKMQGQPGGDR